MEAKIKNIMDNVQAGYVHHQKNIKLLENVYNSVQFDEFLPMFIRIIEGLLQKNFNNPCLKMLWEFLAKFIGHIIKVQHTNNTLEPGEAHPILTAVIQGVLKYHSIPIIECRYNACNFVSLILQNIGATQMDEQICDMIQSAMLENIQDSKPLIRLQALTALARLQDPMNRECPVIKAYLDCLKDSSALVRKEAATRIAPNAVTLPKMKDRTRDIDPNVRSAAFTYVADIGIKYFKIIDRQFILKSGFCENHRRVKKIFLEYLLPKWLTFLNGDYIAFLNAIKLDADETDILNTEHLGKKILEVFCKTEPIGNLIKALPLDENKLLPIHTIQSELAHYWNILTAYLRQSDEMDEHLESIIPELTTFCNYMEKLITTKFAKSMDDWEYLDSQYMLYHLFDITEHYDLSDEVGRRTLDTLIKKVLSNYRLQPRLLNKIVQIGRKLTTSVELFTNEMCSIISEIQQPLIEQQPSTYDVEQRKFKMAELTVKLNILEDDLEKATEAQEFKKAHVLQTEIEEFRKKMEALNTEQPQPVQVRESRDDPETVCWCLDLLSAILTCSDLKTLSPSLITCREEFLKPLIQSKNAEIGCRVFKNLAAYCVFDKKFAEEHILQLQVPIASYRFIPNFDKRVVISSVSIIIDLIRLHGSEFFKTEEDPNTTSSHSSTRRKLYSADAEDVDIRPEGMSVEYMINIILDMLDDENEEIRDVAVTAISKLMLNGFPITSTVMTRLILKWYNPITRFADGGSQTKRRRLNNEKNLQQKLGIIIKVYVDKIKESKAIVAQAIIPIITTVSEAPKTSPLAEVDIDNASRFLAAITDSENTNNLAHVHGDIAHTLIREIASHPAEGVTAHLAKMLNYLNIGPDNSPSSTKELVAQAELLLPMEDLHKAATHHIVKFVSKLNEMTMMISSANVTNTTTNESAQALAVSRRLSNIVEENDGDVQADESNKDGDKENEANNLEKEKNAVAESNEVADGDNNSVSEPQNNVSNSTTSQRVQKRKKGRRRSKGDTSDESLPAVSETSESGEIVENGTTSPPVKKRKEDRGRSKGDQSDELLPATVETSERRTSVSNETTSLQAKKRKEDRGRSKGDGSDDSLPATSETNKGEEIVQNGTTTSPQAKKRKENRGRSKGGASDDSLPDTIETSKRGETVQKKTTTTPEAKKRKEGRGKRKGDASDDSLPARSEKSKRGETIQKETTTSPQAKKRKEGRGRSKGDASDDSLPARSEKSKRGETVQKDTTTSPQAKKRKESRGRSQGDASDNSLPSTIETSKRQEIVQNGTTRNPQDKKRKKGRGRSKGDALDDSLYATIETSKSQEVIGSGRRSLRVEKRKEGRGKSKGDASDESSSATTETSESQEIIVNGMTSRPVDKRKKRRGRPKKDLDISLSATSETSGSQEIWKGTSPQAKKGKDGRGRNIRDTSDDTSSATTETSKSQEIIVNGTTSPPVKKRKQGRPGRNRDLLDVPIPATVETNRLRDISQNSTASPQTRNRKEGRGRSKGDSSEEHLPAIVKKNGAREIVHNSTNLQVKKRKRGRRRKGESSDQSSTKTELSEASMSLLSDDSSQERIPQKLLRNSISHKARLNGTSDDSRSTKSSQSSIRKSTRTKKASKRFR